MPSTVVRIYDRIVSEALVRVYNSRRNITIHPRARLIGRPLITRVDDSCRVEIGAASRIISKNPRNPLGVSHPTTFSLMSQEATILLHDEVGVSGSSLCAARLIEIGAGTLLGADTIIVDTDFHPIDHPARFHAPLPTPVDADAVRIGENCFIGARALVLRGTTLGAGCVVGAGSVVKGYFPPGCVLAGNPARVVRSLTVS